MSIQSIHLDRHLEEIVIKAQDFPCAITAGQLGGKPAMDTIQEIFFEAAKDKLFAHGLIRKEEGREGIYPLTKKGLHFKSFADEIEHAEIAKQKPKIDLINAKRISLTYWWTFGLALAGFLLSLVLSILKIIES